MDGHELECVRCVSAERIKALERAFEEERKERSRRHEKIYNRISALEQGMASVTAQYTSIITQLTSLSGDIKSIKEMPAKRWDTVVVAIITGTVSGLLGFLLSKFGIG